MADIQIAVIDEKDTQIALAVPGIQGPAGAISSGGSANQVFYKVSGTNYDAGWTFIGNANVDAAAAIAGTKISPNFGSQATVTTGTNTAASFIPTSSSIPSNGIYLPGANQVGVATNGTQNLLIDASGNLIVSGANALNTGAGRGNVTINGTAGSILNFTVNGADKGWIFHDNTNLTIQNTTANALLFNTNNGEKMRITSGGLVGIGTSGPDTNLTVYGVNSSTVNSVSNIDVYTTTAYAQDIGGSIGLGGYYNASANIAFANIHGKKENGSINNAAGYFAISTRNNITGTGERMRIDSSGNVGIGTTSPNTALEVNGTIRNGTGSGATLATGSIDVGKDIGLADGQGIVLGTARRIAISSTGTTTLNAAAATAPFIANIGASEAARLDSSGRLLVGTSSSFNGGLLCIGSGQGSNLPSGEYIKIAPSANRIEFLDSSSNSSDTGSISFHNTVYNNRSANIKLYHPAGNTGGIAFETHDGTSLAERMSISAGGNVSIISVTSSAAGTHTMQDSGASPNTLRLYNVTDSNNTGNRFLICDAAASVLRAEIRSNGGLANYSANNANLSDRNVKKDITLAAGTWDCIKEWEIVNYRYKDQPDDADLNLGVIAQQVAESCPEVIIIFQEAKEATEDKPAQEERLGVREQQMYWMAIKALQEAMGRIEQLEAKVAALESA